MKTQKNTSIVNGAIFPALTKFTFPILCSLVLQSLYGAVDLFVVSQFAQTSDVSAVSTGSQTMLIVTGVITGIAVGLSIQLASSIGKNDDERSASIIGNGVWLFSLLTLILTIFVTTLSPTIARLLNSPEEAFAKTVDYILICGLGTLFIVGFNVVNAIFCGLGDSNTPLWFVGIACCVNILADYILVDVFSMGAKGAAIATILSQAMAFIASLFFLKKRLPFKIKKESFKISYHLIFKILKIGSPVALMRMCNEISYLVMLGFVNKLGVVASSGVGIAEKLVMFIVLVPTSYMTSISTFVAQNMGAGHEERARKSLRVGLVSAMVVGGFFAYVSFFHGKFLASLFSSTDSVVLAASEFLKATAIECFILSAAYCFNGYFTGLEKSGFVMVQGIVASLLVRIPYAYFASNASNPTLFSIGFSTAVAAIFIIITSIWYYYKKCPRKGTVLKVQ